MSVEDTNKAKEAQWSKALQEERLRADTSCAMHIAGVIMNHPHLFGLSKRELKAMGHAGALKRAKEVYEAIDHGSKIMMIERPNLKEIDPFMFWKNTWNKFREIGDKRLMFFCRDVYVALTRCAWQNVFTEMDFNVEYDDQPEDRQTPVGFGLRVVK